MADQTTAFPPSLPPKSEDLVHAKGAVVEDTWVEGDHPTDNPDGVTNSNVDYYPKTQEEKAERLLVEMVQPVEVPMDEPYPTGSPPDPLAVVERVHTPQELTSAADWDAQSEENLAAGGIVYEGTTDDDLRLEGRKTR